MFRPSGSPYRINLASHIHLNIADNLLHAKADKKLLILQVVFHFIFQENTIKVNIPYYHAPQTVFSFKMHFQTSLPITKASENK